MHNNQTIILGAGMTGLAAGWVSGRSAYEAMDSPGGICSSYYIQPGAMNRLQEIPEDEEAYRFEIGGGHWIFGGDPIVLRFIRSMTEVKSYERRSSVYFPNQDLYVPYPIQNHMGYLGKDVATKALTEMASDPGGKPKTMAEWLLQNFGETLTELFFAPFHKLYTADLWTQIAPQDAYKSPVSFSIVVQGAFDRTPPVGYNTTFIYPVDGLNTLAQSMEEQCQINYGKKAVRVDVLKKEIFFADGSNTRYETLISTLALNQMMEITSLQVDAEPDPYTSVLVLNIGAIRGQKCPVDHWLYIPDSHSGFHRIGFYSNVDPSFLPASSREAEERVSIYVERAYLGGMRPDETEVRIYKQSVVNELQEWDFIEQIEVIDPTWIDVAYTWSWPESHWKPLALKKLGELGIYQVGRYGRWQFQGIADSVRDGLITGGAFLK